MKRMWFGIGLLLVLLAAGLWLAQHMRNIHAPVIRELEKAAGYALAEDWQQAQLHGNNARTIWLRNRKFSASVADHTPMEEIDGLFGELQVFFAAREPVHFAATCARLCQLAQAMGDAHAVSWWNLL